MVYWASAPSPLCLCWLSGNLLPLMLFCPDDFSLLLLARMTSFFPFPFTEWMERMSHRKWKETKQLPGTPQQGNIIDCCLVYLRFLWYIHSIHSVVPLTLVLSQPCSIIIIFAQKLRRVRERSPKTWCAGVTLNCSPQQMADTSNSGRRRALQCKDYLICLRLSHPIRSLGME